MYIRKSRLKWPLLNSFSIRGHLTADPLQIKFGVLCQTTQTHSTSCGRCLLVKMGKIFKFILFESY